MAISKQYSAADKSLIQKVVALLVEERLALVIYQPKAFEKGVVPTGTLVGAEAGEGGARGRTRP